jgi:hypothetical protein
MEAAGQVIRNGEGRWAIGIGAMDQLNKHLGGNGKAAGLGNDHDNDRGGE